MSILDFIGELVKDQRLFPVLPLVVETSTVAPRYMYCSPAINDLFCKAGKKWMRYQFLRADLIRFTTGGIIRVAEPGTVPEDGFYIRQPEPKEHDIWEIRSKGNPDMRVLGCFAETDHFVALTLHNGFGDPAFHSWRTEILGCKTAWTNTFFPYQPRQKRASHAYPIDFISFNAAVI